MTSREHPLVSVIIPAFDREDTILRAVQSVLNQTYAPFECIVVDDGSTDATAERVLSLDDPRLRLVRHETNQGASAARNTGLAEARGALVAFLDSDDEWLPRKLARQVPFLLSRPAEVGLVYCWMDYVDPAGRVTHEHHPALRGRVLHRTLDQQRLGGCPTLLMPKEVAEGVGGFDTELPRGNDGDFIRRVCREWAVDFQPEVFVLVHTDARNRTSEMTEEGVRGAIRGHRAKLDKFPEELASLPGVHASILRAMASLSRRIGERKQADELERRADAVELAGAGWRKRLALGLPRPLRPLAAIPYLAVARTLAGARRVLKRATKALATRKQALFDRFRLNDLDAIYTPEWLAGRHDEQWLEDVAAFCDAVRTRYRPASLADVGCSIGVYLKEYRRLGVRELLGLEGSSKAVEHALEPEVIRHDVRLPYAPEPRFDLVQCLEVAEHIHARWAETLVRTLAGLCRPGGRIVFTAAPPGQPGNHHINLRPRAYWIALFERHGCGFLPEETDQLKDRLCLPRLPWLTGNLMVLGKEGE